MNRTTNWIVAMVFVLSASGLNVTRAADQVGTSISVEGMHCAGCAKKIETKVKTLSGIAAVKADATVGSVAIRPQPRVNLSPRALWEAVEQTGYKPTKLVGPAGTFTSKPKQ